jgi:hypothetical protein
MVSGRSDALNSQLLTDERYADRARDVRFQAALFTVSDRFA